MSNQKILAGVATIIIGVFIFFVFDGNASVFNNLSVQKVASMIKQQENFVMLDVRTQGEREAGYIKGSILIPVGELAGRIAEIEQYKDKKIVVYCRSGKRSARASQLLVEHGFTKVFNMAGGIIAWQNEGRPVVR